MESAQSLRVQSAALRESLARAIDARDDALAHAKAAEARAAIALKDVAEVSHRAALARSKADVLAHITDTASTAATEVETMLEELRHQESAATIEVDELVAAATERARRLEQSLIRDRAAFREEGATSAANRRLARFSLYALEAEKATFDMAG
jgi:acetylornithine deacetylase/succinyl-diaminopimelate desuccinylase-like protein